MVRYRYRNTESGEIVELDRRIAARDHPVELPGEWERILDMPAFTQASYLDGQKRPASEGYDKIKEAAKLKVALGDVTDSKERARVQKEIHALEKI